MCCFWLVLLGPTFTIELYLRIYFITYQRSSNCSSPFRNIQDFREPRCSYTKMKNSVSHWLNFHCLWRFKQINTFSCTLLKMLTIIHYMLSGELVVRVYMVCWSFTTYGIDRLTEECCSHKNNWCNFSTFSPYNNSIYLKHVFFDVVSLYFGYIF